MRYSDRFTFFDEKYQLTELTNAAVRKAITLLGKYGIKVLGEGTEEGLQQSVSYANLDRVQRGDYDPNANGFERVWNLVTSSGETLQNAAKGSDLDARKQILDAVGQGTKLAALFGGPTAVTFDIASNPVQQTSSQATVKPVQSPTERDIINTEKLWTQQLNEAAGIQPEEVQMVDMDTANEATTWGANFSEKNSVSSFDEMHIAKTSDELLPNYQTAKIPDQKIVGYALNKEHPTGKHKAIAFEKALGYTADNKDLLLLQVYHGLEKYRAVERTQTQYGRPFEVSMMVLGANGRYAKVKTAWIIDNGAVEPRLVSIYVDE